MHFYHLPHSGPSIFEVINNTRGVLLEVFKGEWEKSACKNVPQTRKRSCLVYVLSRKTKMSNGWLSHLHQGTSVLFNFFWISKWNRTDSQWGTDAQKELATHDISPSAAHEGRRRRSWLFGSSLAAMGMMNQEASWAGPLLWAPWTPLLCTALSQAALPPLPLPFLPSTCWELLAWASGGLVSCSVEDPGITHGIRRKLPCLQGNF